ncbi:NADH dehydrogenase [Fulvitalea axinellae]|uniref:NADH:ubiquinone reductase (non-electrogenic) n=1 Tax=Fulvitalea axinellae TaxID=1182444 RepID=A0AAU9CWM8_9BACT|nr:NADH dehydrogenase [Fulvitalea axinellae]
MTLDDSLSIHVPKSDWPRVVIIGGGFAGLKLSRSLVRKKFQVVLIDKHNYHGFQPLLYQVATAGLEPDSIVGPLRQHVEERKNFYFRMLNVKQILPEKKSVATDVGELEYDHLVIATGSKSNFFGNKDIQRHSFPLKKVTEALDLRSQLLQNFEKSVLTKDIRKREALMNVVIVGGGPTGVELAGAIAELRNHVLPQDYPELNLKRMKIYLVEGAGRLLGAMSESSGKNAQAYLEKFDVSIILNKLVQTYDGETVKLNDGTQLYTTTLIWAAGVMGNTVKGLPDEAVERSRYLVNEYGQVKGYEDIFAVGDIACLKTEEHPHGLPMLAPVAIQQGKLLADNLERLREGKSMKPFKYLDKGTMATVGRNKAVVELPGGLRFGGFFAWIVWMFIHLLYIIGFRNKFIIFANWFWNYVTYDRGNRVIIRTYKPKKNRDRKTEKNPPKDGES